MKFTSTNSLKKKDIKKKDLLGKVAKQWNEEADNLINGFSSTNDLKKTALSKVRQSVNQKVERSEEDVKERFNQVTMPIAALLIIDILISFAILVR